MHSSEKYSPTTEEKMIEILNDSITSKDKVAIIGGHYMLLYDRSDKKLKPVIWQELRSETLAKFAEQYAGNFPVRSFGYSIKLHKNLKLRNINSGIVLLINDHKFQSTNFQPDISTTLNGKAGELRKAYFSRNIIPGCYAEILEAECLKTEEVLIPNDNPQRPVNDLLPKKSWFYSEQKLRNRFDDFVKPELVKKGSIRKGSIGNKVEYYFESADHKNDFCLTDNGSCACSAEVIEFITNLLERGFTNIIFFVPNECAEPVNNGVMAALKLKAAYAKVLTISNFGGMGFNENKKFPFKITEHSFE